METLKLKEKVSGIYAYRHSSNGDIAYIGKDSSLITNNRHRTHKSTKRPSLINKQLQKEPDSLVYQQLLICDVSDMDLIEEALISYFIPTYNIEYKEAITTNENDTIKFIKKLQVKYNIGETDMGELLRTIRLRTL